MFSWYRLFSNIEFLATGLVSFDATIVLDGLGQKNILITRGNLVSITYEGTMLSINMNGKNPFRYNDLAVFLDPNNDVWLGIYSAD